MRMSLRSRRSFLVVAALRVVAAYHQALPDPVVVQAPTPQAINVASSVSPQVVKAQPSTVVVQQPRDSGIGDLATGMMLGHMMGGGGAGGGGSTVNRTVVNKTVINKTYLAPKFAPRDALRPNYSPGRSMSSGYSRSSGRH